MKTYKETTNNKVNMQHKIFKKMKILEEDT